MGAMEEVLGLRGPHQSICSGKTDCVVNLIERSSTTLDSVCNRPEFEGTKFKSDDTMEFADEEYPGMKGDALLKLYYQIWQSNRQVLSETVNMGGETNNSGPGRYGNRRSGVDVLFLLC